MCENIKANRTAATIWLQSLLVRVHILTEKEVKKRAVEEITARQIAKPDEYVDSSSSSCAKSNNVRSMIIVIKRHE